MGYRCPTRRTRCAVVVGENADGRGVAPLSGGGQLYDSGSHPLDALLWTTGGTPVEVGYTNDEFVVAGKGGMTYRTEITGETDFQTLNEQKLEKFIAAIDGREAPAVPGEVGLQVTALTEAAHEAAETDAVVSPVARRRRVIVDSRVRTGAVEEIRRTPLGLDRPFLAVAGRDQLSLVPEYGHGTMSDHQSSRSAQLLKVGQIGMKSLIEEPVKESVKEALAEERSLADARTAETPRPDRSDDDAATDEDETGSRVRSPAVLLPVLGLLAVAVAIAKRHRLMEFAAQTGVLDRDELPDATAAPDRGTAADSTARDTGDSIGHEAYDGDTGHDGSIEHGDYNGDTDADELSTTE